MKNIPLPPGAIADLHQRLDRAMTHRDRATIAKVQTCCSWLADLTPTIPVRQLQARADAAARFVTGGRTHG